MKTEKIQLAKIIVDDSLYPRHKISASNVAQLKEALKSGATLPPVVLDKKSLKVIDGWHRIEAVRSLNGEEASIIAELREYGSRQEMLLDAVHMNAVQGYKLTTWDQVRSIVLAIELNADMKSIQKALAITDEKCKKLMERIAVGSKGEKIPLKGSMTKFGGEKITEKQAAYNEGPCPGRSIGLMLAQIIRALEAKVIDFGNPKIVSQFEHLLELYQGAME